jgi:hypothetical protein
MEPRNRSQPGGSVQQPYLSYRPARLHSLAESIPRNRFLGSINVYKYGLRLGLYNDWRRGIFLDAFHVSGYVSESLFSAIAAFRTPGVDKVSASSCCYPPPMCGPGSLTIVQGTENTRHASSREEKFEDTASWHQA